MALVAVYDSATVVTSLGASSVVNNSKETWKRRDEAVPNMSLGSSSCNDSGIHCRPEQTKRSGGSDSSYIGNILTM